MAGNRVMMRMLTARVYIPLKPIARLVVRQAETCRTIDARQAETCRRLSQPIARPLAGGRASVFGCRSMVALQSSVVARWSCVGLANVVTNFGQS